MRVKKGHKNLPQNQTFGPKLKVELEEFRVDDKHNPGETKLLQYRVVATSLGGIRCNIGYTELDPCAGFGPLVFFPSELCPIVEQQVKQIKGAMKIEQAKARGILADSETAGANRID